jgi:hypothetical protein
MLFNEIYRMLLMTIPTTEYINQMIIIYNNIIQFIYFFLLQVIEKTMYEMYKKNLLKKKLNISIINL